VADRSGQSVIKATVAMSDYFLPSLDDVKAISGLEDADAIVDWCHDLGVGHVALKLGPDGRACERWTHAPAASQRMRSIASTLRVRAIASPVAFSLVLAKGDDFLASGALRQRRCRAHHHRLRRGRAAASTRSGARAARKLVVIGNRFTSAAEPRSR
jgi:2-dehydro-3-deoxygluconokinase